MRDPHTEARIEALEAAVALHEEADSLAPLSLTTDLWREGVFHFDNEENPDE